jgi:hypothetical protein
MALVEAIRIIETLKVVHDRRVEVLRFDRGELNSIAFEQYTSQNNIRCEMSPRKTPQMDGTAERHIQTIVNIILSLLIHAKMPSSCWGYAVDFALLIKNSLPVISRNISSPHESFLGIPPKMAHIRTFGCKLLYHLHKDDRRKLDERAMQGIYLGATSPSMVQILDKAGNTITRRFADCIFFEDQFPPVPFSNLNHASDDLQAEEVTLVTRHSDFQINQYLKKREQVLNSPLLPETLKLLKNRKPPTQESTARPIPMLNEVSLFYWPPLDHPHAPLLFFMHDGCIGAPSIAVMACFFIFITLPEHCWLMWEWGVAEGQKICTKCTHGTRRPKPFGIASICYYIFFGDQAVA